MDAPSAQPIDAKDIHVTIAHSGRPLMLTHSEEDLVQHFINQLPEERQKRVKFKNLRPCIDLTGFIARHPTIKDKRV